MPILSRTAGPQMRLLGLGRTALSCAGLICLLFAVYGWRSRPSAARYADDRPQRRDEYDDDYGERRPPPPSDDIRQARY